MGESFIVLDQIICLVGERRRANTVLRLAGDENFGVAKCPNVTEFTSAQTRCEKVPSFCVSQ